ncbi:hypothetical protein KDK95_00140 [Actinospica sp. MGRD01-02]|uniref:Uncharacterized protein n=1 Tax=Actinospica acidithermotolerans TaxID=2828514 RepID=A0A941IE10_9ACTN|nr:hypothetical protein [Actinospica acidithermotolerans]MBR7824700.1 hypothetical protein [Actinospica acidithermotolerans]
MPDDAEHTRLADLSQYGSQLQPVLAPDEVLYAAIPVRLDSDIKDPPSKLLPKSPGLSGHLGGTLERVAPVLAPTETVLTGIFNMASRSKSWDGGWDSNAGQFVIAVYPCKRAEGSAILGASLQFVRTDRRLLVAHLPRRSKSPTPTLIAQFGPGQLRNRPEPPPKRQKHRADLVFPDGSWLALQADTPQQADLLRQVLGAAN